MVRIRLEPPQTHQVEMLGEFFFCLFLTKVVVGREKEDEFHGYLSHKLSHDGLNNNCLSLAAYSFFELPARHIPCHIIV